MFMCMGSLLTRKRFITYVVISVNRALTNVKAFFTEILIITTPQKATVKARTEICRLLGLFSRKFNIIYLLICPFIFKMQIHNIIDKIYRQKQACELNS